MSGVRALLGTSLLWIALSAISDGVVTLVLPVRFGPNVAQDVGGLGLVSFVGLLAGMLVQPVVGAWSDRLAPRVGRQAFLAVGVGLVVLALGGLAAAQGIVAVALAFVGLSIALGVAQAPQQALVADYVPDGQRGRAAGLKGFADLLGATAAFALLGTLLAGGDARPALAALAMAAIVLLAAVVVLLAGLRRRAEAEPAEPRLTTTRRGGVFSLDRERDRSFLLAVAARFAFLLGIYAVGRFLVAYVNERLDLPIGAAAEAAGGLLAVLALVTALGSLPAGFLADRWSRGGLMVGGVAVSMAGVGVLAIAGDLSLMLIGGIGLAAGSALFGVANWAALIDLAPPEEAARYLGLANFGTAGAAATAGLLGFVVDAGRLIGPGAGFLALFASAAVAMVAAAVLAIAIDRPIVQPGGELA